MAVGLAQVSMAGAGDGSPGGAGATPLCTDRPTRVGSPCTVDPGHIQYETDIPSYSRLADSDVRTETWVPLNPTVKYGLTPRLDLEVSAAPYEWVVTRQGSQQVVRHGAGDVSLRVKYEFLHTPWSDVQAAIVPYLKLPTANRGLGNGQLEWGAVLPVT